LQQRTADQSGCRCIVIEASGACIVRSQQAAKEQPTKFGKRVTANQGAAGVDGWSMAEFEANLSGNLYKLWNGCNTNLH